jgi:hypothetical protein
MVVGIQDDRVVWSGRGGRSGEPTHMLPGKIEMTIRLAASSPQYHSKPGVIPKE